MKMRMPEQAAGKRIYNFDEVNRGYSGEQASEEARRCLQCPVPRCEEGCPVGINIKDFIRLLRGGDASAALAKIREKNNLPGICGRVCPQETQCEQLCNLRKDPIGIGHLERFAADRGTGQPVDKGHANGRVAVVGSGPAGLTCAADLAVLGYDVTVYESLHKPGGVLAYGIPAFRLPKKIVLNEIGAIRGLGVKIETNIVVGKTLTIPELKKVYDAVFIGAGAGLPRFMGIPGENLNGVVSANEFLTRINLMDANSSGSKTPVESGKHVIVVGAGNVAMDSARTARRMGADVTVVYRRSEHEMPARAEEVRHAKEEGISFRHLTNPVKIIGDRHVSAVECMKMELGHPDDSGRRRPIPVVGSGFTTECDLMIVAIGQGPNPLICQETPGLESGKKCEIVVRQDLSTSIPGVFAGGDIVSGASTVINAMRDGKVAARGIHKYLS
ncbi:MAG: NADPH-dependent glutamate synthase [archaeon]